MEKIKVTLINQRIKDYYELEKILKRNGIKTEIIQNEENGTELGFGFNELIILLSVLTPVAVQLRKAFEAYLIYKKPLNQKVTIVLERKGKKLKIDSENGEMPNIEEFNRFFYDEQ